MYSSEQSFRGKEMKKEWRQNGKSTFPSPGCYGGVDVREDCLPERVRKSEPPSPPFAKSSCGNVRLGGGTIFPIILRSSSLFFPGVFCDDLPHPLSHLHPDPSNAFLVCLVVKEVQQSPETARKSTRSLDICCS